MILNLWSANQEGNVKLYGGGPRKCSEPIHQHCMYLALTDCVLYLLLVKGGSFRKVYRLIDLRITFSQYRIPCDTGTQKIGAGS